MRHSITAASDESSGDVEVDVEVDAVMKEDNEAEDEPFHHGVERRW